MDANHDLPRDVPGYPNPAAPDAIDYDANRREIVDYFTARQARLEVVKTTTTPRGQTIDWVPIESQYPGGKIATPPPEHRPHDDEASDRRDTHAIGELAQGGCEVGPPGTVPILRKKLEALSYSQPLRRYLSKMRAPVPDEGPFTLLPPGPGRGTHWYGNSKESKICWGAEGQFSCFAPFVASKAQSSIIQMALTNSDLPAKQTVEAGWQTYHEITGDFLPHLFVYYTTNGYALDADNVGGYNRDVDGWIQHDNVIFPGTTFAPLSRIDGEQRKISLKFQHFRDNWWLSCQGRWVGYYPGRLFMGNQSVFSTLGDHADHVGFWGEVASRESTATTTDMGSGRFPSEGFGKSAYFHHLRVQADRVGGMISYRGGSSRTDKNLYDIDAHFDSDGNWGSFAFVGGPGAV